MSRIIFRPWDTWTDGPAGLTNHNFSAGWEDTKSLLRAEVEKVCLRSKVDDTLIVLQVDVSPSDIRQDGFMRADRKVRSDGVIVSFDSQHGPLRYACNQFTGAGWRSLPGWQANVRAIALGLSDLRRLDRYGIARRGEQYIGFGALPPGRPMQAAMTLDEAARLLWAEADMPLEPRTVGAQPEHDLVVRLYRSASKKHHPDVGGDPAMFARVTQARDLLIGA